MSELTFPYIRIFTLLILIIGGCEYALMLFFDFLHIETFMHAYAIAFLDAVCLILLASPLVYLTVIRPLIQKSRAYQRKLEVLLSALDGAGDCIMVTNSEGHVTYTNQAFTNITGYTSEDILGKNPRMLQSGKQDQQFYKTMWHTIHTVGEWRGELWNRRKDGSEYLEALHIKEIHTKHSSEPYYIGIMTDITMKKQHDNLLAHSEKMASIGTLVGGIAHNFNNLLSGIIGNAYLAQDERNPGKTNERLQLIERISFEASEMVKSLLVFARNHAPKKKNLAIAPVLKQAIQTAKLGLPDDIELHIELPDEQVMLYCDAVEIQQVMLNLISNAHDALPEQGNRAIRIEAQETHCQDSQGQQNCDDPCSADALKISIQDTGCGIAKENLPYVFDPFFSTKEVGKGTGLGLSTAFSTVQAHGGRIHIHNLEPVGCSVEICFPLAVSANQSETHDSSTLKPAKKTATILIVDDEMMVRNTLQQILESLGYKTMSASQGKEAMDIAKHHPIHLVISDIMMPILDGISSVSMMRQSQPKLPVIFITGYDHKFAEAPEDEQTRCIAKPFDIKELSQEVATLLSLES